MVPDKEELLEFTKKKMSFISYEAKRIFNGRTVVK